MRLGREFAAFLIIALAVYAMFSSKRFARDDAKLLSLSIGRAFGFLGRTAVFWIIVSLPAWIGEAINQPVLRWLASIELPRPELIAAYYGIVVLSVLCLSALRARLAFYLPSAAYAPTPWTLARTWQATRSAFARLFVMFLLVDAVTVAMEFVIILVCYRFFKELGLDILVHSLRLSYGGDPAFMVRAVPEAFIFILEYTPASLLQAALSVIAYRRLAAGEQTIATVFD